MPLSKRATAQRCRRLFLHAQQALGRSLAARKLERNVPRGAKLHLGCGPNHLSGWINIDIDRTVRPDIRLDLRFGLPAEPHSISFIYSEHVLEHLSLENGQRLLRDCYRLLVPGGAIRIAMPDLAALVEAYRGEWRDQPWLKDRGYPHLDTPAHMLNLAMREWGHLYVYDSQDLHLRLTQAGFIDINSREWGQSPHQELQGLEKREESNLIAEASVP